MECVCQRCKDKLEWRKKYRKYKPRTQPGSCNICKQKRVLAAYHTICRKCTTSEQAWKQLREQDTAAAAKKDTAEEETTTTKLSSAAAMLAASANTNVDRVCAMCVKEVALKEKGAGGANVTDLMNRVGPMSLRDKRSLERQLVKELAGGDAGEEEEEDSNDHEDEEKGDTENKQADTTDHLEEDEDVTPDQIEDPRGDDPFLKAVGGAEKLLTGEAYQEMILSKQQEAS